MPVVGQATLASPAELQGAEQLLAQGVDLDIQRVSKPPDDAHEDVTLASREHWEPLTQQTVIPIEFSE